MGQFADELHAGIDEAIRKMTEARLAGDDCGAEAYCERLGFLCRVANRHGLGPWPCPKPAAGPAWPRYQDAPALIRNGIPAPRAG